MGFVCFIMVMFGLMPFSYVFRGGVVRFLCVLVALARVLGDFCCGFPMPRVWACDIWSVCWSVSLVALLWGLFVL